MSIFLIFLGTIFLALLFALVVFFLLSYVWTQRLSKKFQQSRSDSLELKGINSQSLDYFSEFPILGRFFKKQFASMKGGISYFNSSIPQILSDWSSLELVTRSTQRFIDSLEAGEPEKSFMSHLENLGGLRGYKGIKEIEGSKYLAEAAFERGLAQIKVQLVQDGDQWFIDNFEVVYLFQSHRG
jgi:hypothetical protein